MVFEHQDLASNQPFQASCKSFCGPPILGIWSVQFLQMFHLNVLETAKKNCWSIHPVLARCKAVGPNVAWWESCHKRPTGHPLHKPFPCNTWESITLVFARVPSHILPPWTGSESPQMESNSLKPNSGTASSLSCNQATQIRDFLAHRWP